MNLNGLNLREVEESREKYGTNNLTQLPLVPLWKKILLGFKDPMIMILLAALAVQVLLFALGQAEWFEPVGILIAILVANGVSSISEKRQEGKASALKSEELSREIACVMRNGKKQEINVGEVVKGDIVCLQAGDKIPADGYVASGTILVDQAALNGETEEAEKYPYTEGNECDIKNLLNKNYIYRGTVVCAGECYMQVDVVGDNTLFGHLALEVQEETRETPLQLKLRKLAKLISVFGYIGAICIMGGVVLATVLSGNSPDSAYAWLRLFIDAITVAVTIIVCAVPEGLPMLTSILLSFQSIRMAKDNVLVRKINGLETAGSLSLLFSDKTGTITEGKLSVVEMALGNVSVIKKLEDMKPGLRKEVVIGIGKNNSADYFDGKVIGGNITDRALMQLIAEAGEFDSLNKIKVKDFNAFDSTRKFSDITITVDGKNLTYIKGAPEKLLENCTHYLDEDGSVNKIDNIDNLVNYIDIQASRSMRLLCVARIDYKEDKENLREGLTLVCILCIRDNVRKEAIDAIKEVQEAGVQVAMITGDRRETAAAIARDSGLVKSEEDVILTSDQLGQMTDDEVKDALPRLRVVARALPTDKSRLVRLGQELDMVVGMTGDGVNDSPALKKADVGFAMGSGTEVAKEAGDITILDDNFISISKAILYGRTMFKNIRKFLIFQLTVNISAVLICFIGPLMGQNIILTVIQLLLINLVMDTLAAISFGSEPALKEYMRDRPVPRNEGIITKPMFVEIIVAAAYITVICLGILFIPPISNLFGDVSQTYLRTALFATFMMAITFNGFNARTSRINIFKGIGKNKSFIGVTAAILLIQFIFITFGGEVLSVEPLSLSTWITCFILAVIIIPVDIVRKIIVNLIKK